MSVLIDYSIINSECKIQISNFYFLHPDCSIFQPYPMITNTKSTCPGAAPNFRSPREKQRFRGCRLSLATAAGFVVALPASAGLFTPGVVVVTAYGNVGNAATNSLFSVGVPTPISLLEFSPSGAVGSAPLSIRTLPTADSGSNYGIVGEYGSSSEGTIQLSGDGRFLTLGGYGATASYAGAGGPAGGYSDANGVKLAQSTDASVPRVFALIDAAGGVDSRTAVNNIYSRNNARSAYTQDGTMLYVAGQGTGTTDQGLYYTSVGTNTMANPGSGPTTIDNAVETRVTQIYQGNLYYSTDKKNKATGIFEYSGMPTDPRQTARQIIPANNGGSGEGQVNYSPEGFYFANATTLYVVDTGVPKNGGRGDGGIQKWSFNGASWVLEYTLSNPQFIRAPAGGHGETGFEAIAGRVVGTGAGARVELFAVSYTLGDGDPDGLYTITDSLAASKDPGETFTEMEASGPNRLFKGVAFAPTAEPGM